MLADEGMGPVHDAQGRFPRGLAINPAALRQARSQAHLTLDEASRNICSRQALHQFESGRIRPRRPTLVLLADRLHVPLDALLARPHDPREQSMRELEEQQRWDELERLARAILADTNVTRRTQGVAMLFLGRAVHQQAPIEALPLLRMARGLLAKSGEPWLAAEARDWEGASLYHLQDPTALEVGQDALGRYRMLTDRDPGIEARMLEHIGTYLLQREELPQALDYYRRAIDTAGPLLNLARLALIYHGMASGCIRLGESRQATEYFERAVHLSRIHHDVKGAVTVGLARLENDYGECLLRLGRWDRAEEMLLASLDHFDAAGVEVGKNAVLLSIGDLHHRRGDVDEAMRWTSQAIELAERLGEQVSLAVAYQQLGELWSTLGNLDSFESCFARAVEIVDRAGLRERRREALDRYRRVRSDLAAAGMGS
jgi:tetratricopeptide (TPR) repeat protein